MAVSSEHWLNGPKIDPKYVQFVGSYNVKSNGSYSESYFPLHLCTEDDYSKFFPVSQAVAAEVNKKKEKNLFYCTPDLTTIGVEELFGTWTR